MDKKERIIRVAIDCFSKKGFYGVNVELIARKAGVSKGTVFYYFGSKKNLYLKAIERSIRPLLFALSSRIEKIGTPEALFEEIVSSYLDFLYRNKKLFTIIIRDMTDGGKNTGVFLKNAIEEAGLKEKLLRKIEVWKKIENISDLNPEQVVIHFLSMLYFPIIAEPFIKEMFNVDPRSDDYIKQRKKTIVKLLMGGIQGGENEK